MSGLFCPGKHHLVACAAYISDRLSYTGPLRSLTTVCSLATPQNGLGRLTQSEAQSKLLRFLSVLPALWVLANTPFLEDATPAHFPVPSPPNDCCPPLGPFFLPSRYSPSASVSSQDRSTHSSRSYPIHGGLTGVTPRPRHRHHRRRRRT